MVVIESVPFHTCVGLGSRYHFAYWLWSAVAQDIRSIHRLLGDLYGFLYWDVLGAEAI